MRAVSAVVLAGALMACGDADPLGPALPVSPPASPVAAAPIQDALERVLPTLDGTDATAELHRALSAVLTDGSANIRADVELALQRVEAEQPDAAAEADVIRLAVAAQP